MPALGNVLLDALAAHGAREISGIPGDFVPPFFKMVEESGRFPSHTLSHEPAIGFAADAAARFHANILVTVVTSSDGAFRMTGFDLGNCRRYNWDPIVIVFNSRGQEMLRASQPKSTFTDLDDWNFRRLANPSPASRRREGHNKPE